MMIRLAKTYGDDFSNFTVDRNNAILAPQLACNDAATCYSFAAAVGFTTIPETEDELGIRWENIIKLIDDLIDFEEASPIRKNKQKPRYKINSDEYKKASDIWMIGNLMDDSNNNTN
ncbi:kinase-like domain-containing protein [Rhizophagus clarus]|uniref:Kinase-like domain-containing protein n=1 Tax=Rhizophagus clarus TaxID=94130 RepID=A0A8H3M6B3_9GLOM|nr:kinase-like domain-containing protein [Rhizophagus clarus]